VGKIKEAVQQVGLAVRNDLFMQLYKESAFTMLEKLLQSTPFGDTLMIFVYHISHLLLRLLLFPDSE